MSSHSHAGPSRPLPVPQIHIDKAKRAAQKSALRSRARQCVLCRRCWPLVTFPDGRMPDVKDQCLRCSQPQREVTRWLALHVAMIGAAESARNELHLKTLHQHSDAYPYAYLDHPHALTWTLPQLADMVVNLVKHSPPGRPAKFDYRYNALTEEQLAVVAGDVEGLKGIQEPARAAMWVQLNFRPAPPSSPIRQMHIFEAYGRFLKAPKALMKSRPDPLTGAEVVRMPEKIWPGQVILRGTPLYDLQGLEARPSIWMERGRPDGQLVMPVHLGQGATFGSGEGAALTAPTLTASATLPLPLPILAPSVPVPQVVPHPHQLVAPPTTHAAPPTATATAMSRRTSNNPPPLIEAALAQNQNVTLKRARENERKAGRGEGAGEEGSGKSVAMEATSSTESNDWEGLRGKRPRISREHLQTLAKGKMVPKGLEIISKSTPSRRSSISPNGNGLRSTGPTHPAIGQAAESQGETKDLGVTTQQIGRADDGRPDRSGVVSVSDGVAAGELGATGEGGVKGDDIGVGSRGMEEEEEDEVVELL